MSLTESQRQSLRQLAWDSLRHGLSHGGPLEPEVERYDPPLQQAGASFVTLQKHGELRGCIGSLAAHRPLVLDVAYNAYAAGFSDPRFPPLRADELDALDLHISLLSPTQPLAFTDQADLLRQLRPGVDGLVLSEGHRRGTFLPAVWESLPKAEDFLYHLKLKAGLPTDYWSDTLRVERYTVDLV